MQRLLVFVLCWTMASDAVVPVYGGVFRRAQLGNGGACGNCDVAGANCQQSPPCQAAGCQQPCEVQHETVQKTVMVPTWETQTVSVPCTVYRPETRETTETVMKQVPQQRQISREVCFLVPEQRTRTINYTEYQTTMETQERQFAVPVPYQETRTATREVCRLVPEQRTRTEQFLTCRTVMQQQEQAYTVMVPYEDTRTATRTVCRMVPEQRTRTVCEDQGSWQTVACNQPCGGCNNGCQFPNDAGQPYDQNAAPQGSVDRQTPPPAPPRAPEDRVGGWLKGNQFMTVAFRRGARGGNCGGCGASPCAAAAPCAPATRQVWVPNIVRREETYTVQRPVYEQVPYQYTVTCMRPEQRTRTIQVPHIVTEPQTREVAYTVMVPQTEQQQYQYPVQLCRYETRTQTIQVPKQTAVPRTREVAYTVMVPRTETRTETITEMVCVPEQQTRTYTVQVPVTEERQVEQRVCRMVPQTIECRQRVASAGCCQVR